MARQRSGSSSARNSRGPRGSRRAATRPAAKSSAKQVVEPEAQPEEPSPPVVDEPTSPAAEEPAAAETEAAETEAAETGAAETEYLEETEPEEELADFDDGTDDFAQAAPVERSAETAELWAEARIAPVHIALPRGDGYTLRAYRMSNELAAVEVDEREDEFAEYLGVTADSDEADLAIDDDEPEPAEDDELTAEAADDADRAADGDADGDEDADTDADADAGAEAAAEEVPVFLGRRGKIYLFATPELLVDFIRTTEDHDLAQLDTWSELRERVTPADVVPDPEDRYELDLVVDNLRGGADALDLRLLIQAGEVARDIGYATRLEPVVAALAPGSPLDDLDEAVRAADNGGLRGFLARRKLRRIATQQTALGWRTIIGKISSVVDWRN